MCEPSAMKGIYQVQAGDDNANYSLYCMAIEVPEAGLFLKALHVNTTAASPAGVLCQVQVLSHWRL